MGSPNFVEKDYLTVGKGASNFTDWDDLSQKERKDFIIEVIGCEDDEIEENEEAAKEVYDWGIDEDIKEVISQVEDVIFKKSLPIKIEYGYHDGFRLILDDDCIDDMIDRFNNCLYMGKNKLPTNKMIKQAFCYDELGYYLNPFNDTGFKISMTKIIKLKREIYDYDTFINLVREYFINQVEKYFNKQVALLAFENGLYSVSGGWCGGFAHDREDLKQYLTKKEIKKYC